MVKILSQPARKVYEFLQRKAYEWGGGGNVRYFGGYPFYFQDKKVSLDTNSIVQICIGWEARNFCEPPGAIQTLTAKGMPEWEYDHPLPQLFRRPEPEGNMTGRRLYKALLASRRLDGNGYLDVIPNSAGTPVELRYIPYWSIEPIPTKGTGLLDHYEITLANGSKETREVDEIFHTADGIDDRNPLKGCAQLKTAMRLVMTDNAATASGERLMRNLGVIGLMVSPGEAGAEIKSDDRKLLTSQLNQQFGQEGQGSSFVASRNVKVDYLGADASKLGFREMHMIPEERISAIFGYSAMVLSLGSGLQRSTFNNMAEAREAATEQTLVPLWAEVGDDITVQLGPRFNLKPNQSFAYDLKNVKILQEDEDNKWGRVGTAYQNGGLKRGEYRTAIGYDAGPEDDVYLQDLQSGGADQTGKQAEISKARARMSRKMKDGRIQFEAIQEGLS